MVINLHRRYRSFSKQHCSQTLKINGFRGANHGTILWYMAATMSAWLWAAKDAGWCERHVPQFPGHQIKLLKFPRRWSLQLTLSRHRIVGKKVCMNQRINKESHEKVALSVQERRQSANGGSAVTLMVMKLSLNQDKPPCMRKLFWMHRFEIPSTSTTPLAVPWKYSYVWFTIFTSCLVYPSLCQPSQTGRSSRQVRTAPKMLSCEHLKHCDPKPERQNVTEKMKICWMQVVDQWCACSDLYS